MLDGGVLLDTEAAAAPALAERLARFVFRYDVTVGQPVAGAASVLGPGADAALVAAGLPVPGPGRAGIAGAGAGRPPDPGRRSTWSARARPPPPPSWSGPASNGRRPSAGSWPGWPAACHGPGTS